MPLDRRATIRIEDAEGDVLEIPVWCDEQSGGSSDVQVSGGVQTTAVRNFIIRHDPRIARAAVSQIEVVDRFGDTWNADTVSLSDARDRFISIQAIREVGASDVPDTPAPAGALTFTAGADRFTRGVRSFRWYVSDLASDPSAHVGDEYNVDTPLNQNINGPNSNRGIFASWKADATMDEDVINTGDPPDSPVDRYEFVGRAVITIPTTSLTSGYLFVFWYDDSFLNNPDTADITFRAEAE